MKLAEHIQLIHREIETMTLEGHIDTGDKFIASEDLSSALARLAKAIEYIIENDKPE